MSAKNMTKNKSAMLQLECTWTIHLVLVSAVAGQLEIPRSQIYQNFPTKNAVLRFFYQDCLNNI